jgi:hypothetical protein
MNHWSCICAECEELRRDAERYRYLRDRAGNGILDELAAESRPRQWDAIVDEWNGE